MKMRPRIASQPLLIHMNCCHQHCSLPGLSASSSVNQGLSSGGFCCLATVKVRMPHPPLTLIYCIQVGLQLVQWEGEGKLGLLSHQGTSWAR